MLPLLLLVGCSGPEPVTHDTLGLAESLAGQSMDTWETRDLAFDWIPTVLEYGMHRVYAAGGSTEVQSHYRAWVDEADERGLYIHSSDSLSPNLLAAVLMIEDGDAAYAAMADNADAYLATAPRTSLGAIEHYTDYSPFGVTHQVWVDSQFMFGPYLVLQHERTGDEAYLDLFVEQYGLFSQHCRDEADQLYRHAYDDVTGDNIPEEAVYWARGNSWVLVAAAELLDRQDVPEVREPFVAHAEAILAAQDPDDGLWHTVLNEPRGGDPDNYTETSASALIAYGLIVGVRSGALDPETTLPAVSRAVHGLVARIDEESDGWLKVEGTSLGTVPGDYDYYVGVGQADNLMLGVGSLLMLLAEAHGVEDPLAAP